MAVILVGLGSFQNFSCTISKKKCPPKLCEFFSNAITVFHNDESLAITDGVKEVRSQPCIYLKRKQGIERRL